jgi:NADH-quinone oxidoreductase subunit A
LRRGYWPDRDDGCVSYVLGQRHTSKSAIQPYESGIVIIGCARFRFPVKFYLVAMFSVIFDVELVFIYAWTEVSRTKVKA